MKKIFAIFAITAMVGVFFWASPVNAAHDAATAGQSVSTSPSWLPATVGTVTVTLSGTGYDGAAQGVYIVSCPGANGDADEVTAATASALCPGIATVVFAANVPTSEISGGAWSFDLEIDVTQEVIDAGAFVVTVGHALDLAGMFSERIILSVVDSSGDDAPAATGGDDLANTGVESQLLLIIGGSIVLAGLAFAGLGRRFRRS